MTETISFNRRNLPHWMVAEHAYFVTLRQKGTIPRAVVEELRAEREALLSKNASREDVDRLAIHHFMRLDAILDSCRAKKGKLAIPECAQAVIKSFTWLEGEYGWSVFAVTVMPNHVHAVMRNINGHNGDLNKDLGRLKSFTSREINRHIGREGTFWQSENFDRWCRTPEEFDRFCAYTINNPVKAGLVDNSSDWPWVRAK